MDLLLLIRQQPRNSKSAAAMSTALLRRLAITGPTAAARQTFSARHRNDGKIYWPGSGIRSEKELAEEAKCAREGNWPAEHPFKYTFTGKRRLTNELTFHYTDRKAGKGYTDFAERPFKQRPYIWPGVRQVNPYYFAIFALLGIPLVVDLEWLYKYGPRKCRELFNKIFRADAATTLVVEKPTETGDERQAVQQGQAVQAVQQGQAVQGGSTAANAADEEEATANAKREAEPPESTTTTTTTTGSSTSSPSPALPFEDDNELLCVGFVGLFVVMAIVMLSLS